MKEWLGKSVYELPTPSIIVDMDELDTNLKLLSDFFNDKNCKLRPHFKSHKCVTLAKQQLTMANTIGIACAKLSEAEQLVAGGIRDVLIANQVIGKDKVKRIAEMNKKAKVRVAVDSEIGIKQLNDAAIEAGIIIGVLIEVDIGMNRGGIDPGQAVIDMANIISTNPGLILDGLQSYEGHIVTLEDYDERKKQVEESMVPLIDTRHELEKMGFDLFLSSGGTGTYDITGEIKGIDELQCGSYALMDSAYKKIRPEFLNARYILATVISKRENTVSFDVGLKGMGAEYGMPQIIGHPQAKALYVAEEHTIFQDIDVEIGDKLCLIPPHGCTTNNLHSHMWAAQNDIIKDIWPVEGRGCVE